MRSLLTKSVLPMGVLTSTYLATAVALVPLASGENDSRTLNTDTQVSSIFGNAEQLSEGRFKLQSQTRFNNSLNLLSEDAATSSQEHVSTALGLSYGINSWLELTPFLNLEVSPSEFQSGSAAVASRFALVDEHLFALNLRAGYQSAAFDSANNATTSEAAMLGGRIRVGNATQTSISMNVDSFYRQPYAYASSLIGNELAANASLTQYLSRSWYMAAFANGKAMTVKSSDASVKNDSSQREFLVAGLSTGIGFSGIEIALSSGKMVHSLGFTNAAPMLSLSIDYSFGRAPAMTVLTKEERKEIDAGAKPDAPGLAAPKPVDAEPESLEHYMVKPAELAPLPTLDLFHDGRVMLDSEQRLDSEKTDLETDVTAPNFGTDIAPIDKVEEELRRAEGWKNFQERLEQEEQYRKELEKQIETNPLVTDEDYQWTGLE